jgi:hypothetical protein
MANPTRDEFEKYAKDNHWLKVDEPANPAGRQFNFVTPEGNFVVALFNLEGQLLTAVPMPSMAQISTQGRGLPGFPPGFMNKG